MSFLCLDIMNWLFPVLSGVNVTPLENPQDGGWVSAKSVHGARRNARPDVSTFYRISDPEIQTVVLVIERRLCWRWSRRLVNISGRRAWPPFHLLWCDMCLSGGLARSRSPESCLYFLRFSTQLRCSGVITGGTVAPLFQVVSDWQAGGLNVRDRSPPGHWDKKKPRFHF